MKHSEKIDLLAAALVRVQGQIGPAIKGNTNPHFKSKYADLGAVWEACRNALQEAGVAVIQTPHSTDGTSVTVTTTLVHTGGQWISGDLTLKPSKADPQGIGSAITYGRRYGLASMVGICSEEDDDGNQASRPAPAQRATPQKAPVSDPRAEFRRLVHSWSGVAAEDVTAAGIEFIRHCGMEPKTADFAKLVARIQEHIYNGDSFDAVIQPVAV